MALALSLPDNFAYKEMITITTFGVVLFTLLIPGLTIEPLVTLLKMNAKDPKREQYKMLKAQLMAKKRALAFVSNQLKTGTITATNHDLLHNELQQAKEELIAQIENLHLEDSSIKALEEEELRHRILELEKDCYKGLVKDGALSEESLQKIELEQHETLLSKIQTPELPLTEH
jgi:CPA1 family monovalent cation:H+ antiporter